MTGGGGWWRSFPIAALLAVGLTYIALVLTVLIVEQFGLWGFWLVMSSAAVFPPWLVLRSRLP
jgi:hypothetical protein